MNSDFADAAGILISELDGIASKPGVTLVKSNMVRTVYRLEAGGVRLFVKAYHSSGPLEALKALIRPSRALSEWNAMIGLQEAGIATARPVLYGEKRRFGTLRYAYFAATEVEDALSFGAFVEHEREQGRWNAARKDAVYTSLAGLTARLHAAAIRHGDFHLGNILVRGDDVFLIDLHTVSFPARLDRASKILNLARAAEVLGRLDGGEDLALFLGRYLEASPGFAPSEEALRSEVTAVTRRLDRRRLKSRTRRCMKKSSEFARVEREGYVLRHRRRYAPEKIIAALAEHDRVTEGDERLLHPVFKNKVTAVHGLCVKEYLSRSLFKRLLPQLSEARRSWIAGRGLEVRGIATPETAAWVRGRGREFLVTAYAPAVRLHDFIKARCAGLEPRAAATEQKTLAVALAPIIRKIHDTDIRHRDLSEQNILAIEGPRFLLIDLDTLAFGRSPSFEMRMKNLMQLGHMPDDVSVLAKARFLSLYLGPGRRKEWRAMMRLLDAQILARMTRKRVKFERLGLDDPHPRPSKLKGSW